MAGWILYAGVEDSLDIATVAGLFIAVAALALAVADYFRPGEALRHSPASLADDLAATVQEQWQKELSARRLSDPKILPFELVGDPTEGG